MNEEYVVMATNREGCVLQMVEASFRSLQGARTMAERLLEQARGVGEHELVEIYIDSKTEERVESYII